MNRTKEKMRVYAKYNPINKNKNTENGITLIALIVTIIILLVLAAVTISISTDGNGIIAHAKKSNSDARNAQAKEQIQFEITRSYGLDGNLDTKALKSNLEKKGANVIEGEKNTLIVTLYEHKFSVDMNGRIEEIKD